MDKIVLLYCIALFFNRDSVQSCIQTCMDDVLLLTSLSWTPLKQRLLVVHLFLAWLTESVQTSTEIVFLSKYLFNTWESNSIGRCRRDSTLTALVVRRSWNSDEPHQSDHISPKVLLQDLSRQWSFLALIIVTQIFAGLPAEQIARLQGIQNNAVRLLI